MNTRLATLDRMLEDLKSTVTSEDESPGFRSSGRSPSRSLANGRTVDTGLTGSGRPSLDMGHPMDVGLCTSNETHTTSDGGRVSHHRKEYASPDNSVRTYADTYQYDSGPAQQGQHFQKKVMKSTYSSYNTEGGLSKDLQDLKKGPSDQEMDRALSESSRNIINSSKYSTSSVERKEDRRVVDASHSVARELVDALSVIGNEGKSLNGGYISDDMLCKDEKGGEVRRIVWRNRYEKTYEAGDTAPPQPSMSIERDARSLRVDVPEDPTLGGLTRPHVPPQMSPATPQPGRSHVDMTSSSHHTSNHTTTSHNLREETNKYSSDNRYNDTTPRHLPEGNTHTYSSVNTIRDTSNDTYGRPTPVLPPSSPPTNKNNFNYSLSSSEHYTRDTRNNDRYPNNDLPLKPYEPPMKERSPSPPRYARIESSPTRNITININKSHTTTTTTTDDTRGGLPPYSDGPSPVTSTPYHRGSSRSPDRTRKQPPYASGPSDSLDRVRRPPNQGLPFPSPSPNAPGSTPVPRKVDELMSDFSSERAYDWERTDREPLMRNHQKAENGVHLPPPERNDINTVSPRELQEREKTKNTAGAAVYYPPTQENFQESMHTMTLKEGGRRGKAKWRAEGKSGYKESSSHSEMKGGATMVPVCLPLCCGAACNIM